jgi:predicted PurR-regulated permease PerM
MQFTFISIFLPVLIICVLIFCFSFGLLIIKRKTLKKYNVIVLIFLLTISSIPILFSFVLLFGFYNQKSGHDEVYKMLDNNEENTEVELFHNDFEIVQYNEIELDNSQNNIQINITIKILNEEKLNILKTNISPLIYLHTNNTFTLFAKGHLSILTSPSLSVKKYLFVDPFPEEYGCFFPIDNDGKIIFFEQDTMEFIGFNKKIK